MKRVWTKHSIAAEILDLYEHGADLNYASVIKNNSSVVQAANRHFGSWEAAVNFAGFDYSHFRRYKSWCRERIIARIQELHAQGIDLSWQNIKRNADPQLASAAVKKGHFGSWRDAVEASGLDYDAIRKYRDWDEDRVLTMVREFHERGAGLNAKNMGIEDITLITAARRRFESWPQALTAAGLDYHGIVQRAPFRRGQGRGQYKRVTRKGVKEDNQVV